jgi:hypothetical protein
MHATDAQSDVLGKNRSNWQGGIALPSRRSLARAAPFSADGAVRCRESGKRRVSDPEDKLCFLAK